MVPSSNARNKTATTLFLIQCTPLIIFVDGVFLSSRKIFYLFLLPSTHTFLIVRTTGILNMNKEGKAFPSLQPGNPRNSGFPGLRYPIYGGAAPYALTCQGKYTETWDFLVLDLSSSPREIIAQRSITSISGQCGVITYSSS
jgi:hypothetical protein